MKASKEPIKLKTERIQMLARRINVSTVSVENFLFALNKDSNKRDAELNLYVDARDYGWNKETQLAIKEGIQEFFATESKAPESKT
jgi:hypothetical protein